MKHTIELLQPFCSNDTGRHPIMKPFSRPDGFTYATNGRILVRVPRMDGVAEGGVSKAEGIVPQFKRLDSPVSLPDPCAECGGAGQRECATCHHREQCVACDGTGVTGGLDDGLSVAIKIGSQHFDAQYIRQVRGLPALQFFNAAEATGGAYFTFEGGGEGVLMPMRVNGK